MNKKAAFVKKLKTRLEEWKKELEQLEAEAREGRGSENRRREHMEKIGAKVRQAREALKKVEKENEDPWGELKEDAGRIWESFSENVRKAASEFKRGYREGGEDD